MKNVMIKTSKCGDGVFATRTIQSGELIMQFRGPIIRRADMPYPYPKNDDHWVQVGEDEYMGPSGGPDDFVNHSCDPNAGLKLESSSVVLVAIKKIKKGEEVTWDYSTTMFNDDWIIECMCGSLICRGQIREFRYLSADLKKHYVDLGIVPKYVNSEEV